MPGGKNEESTTHSCSQKDQGHEGGIYMFLFGIKIKLSLGSTEERFLSVVRMQRNAVKPLKIHRDGNNDLSLPFES